MAVLASASTNNHSRRTSAGFCVYRCPLNLPNKEFVLVSMKAARSASKAPSRKVLTFPPATPKETPAALRRQKRDGDVALITTKGEDGGEPIQSNQYDILYSIFFSASVNPRTGSTESRVDLQAFDNPHRHQVTVG